MGLTLTDIAKNLGISTGTVCNVLKRFTQTGDVHVKKHPKRDRKLDRYHEIYIINLILDSPSLQLKEITSKVLQITGTSVSSSTLCRLLARFGFTRKKVQRIALQRSMAFRALFMANTIIFSQDKFVWVDETGCNFKDMLRKYGYAFSGERAAIQHLLVRGQRISSIAAICTDGLIALETTPNSVNGEKFFDFVRGSLIPEMMPFDGHNPKSIVVMDNCSIHHVQQVSELFLNAGILVLYLPPYSPDMNPIELLFNHVKQYLKEHEDIMFAIPPVQLIKSAFSSVTAELCTAWIQHCGY